jgi:hypothetical protein
VRLTTNHQSGQTEKDDMRGAIRTYGEEETAYTVLVVRPEGKKTFGRLASRWKIILWCVLKKSVGRTWLRTGKLVGSSERCNKVQVP